MATVLESVETAPLVVKMPPSVVGMNDDQFFDFCQANPELRIERTAEGEILITPLTGFGTGRRNMAISARLFNWAERDGMGVALDSTTAFRLSTSRMERDWVGCSTPKREGCSYTGLDARSKCLTIRSPFRAIRSCQGLSWISRGFGNRPQRRKTYRALCSCCTYPTGLARLARVLT